MLLRVLSLVSLSQLSRCSPASGNSPRDSSAPTAIVKNGTYYGYYAPQYGTDNFLGMPYAQPPVGNLRYRVPQPLNTTWNGARNATEYGPECFGYGLDTESQGNYVSEDCLTINVVRPHGTKAGDNLPVGFWIHGGGLYEGGSADHRYNLTFIVQESVSAGRPIVAVSVNYRLSAWGFLYGQEVQDSGQTMLGFRDQRLGLQWAKENLEAFGGDPNHVTIWGQSAGASSVGIHLTAYNGRDDQLFVGAISESGTAAKVAAYPTVESWQPVYDALVAAVGCNTSDSLQCLRTIPTTELNAAINSSVLGGASYGAVIDGDLVQHSASIQYQQGQFVKVPYLVGANADEGTMFGPHGINTTTDFLNYLNKTQVFDNETAQTLSYLYPDIPAIGIPGTWHGRPPATSEFGTQYKRSSAVGGDVSQHATRRLASLTWAAQSVPVYSYYFDVLVNGQPYTAGSTHFQEVAFVFYNTEGYGYPQNLLPNPLGGVLRPQYLALAKIMTRMWIGFISTGNPNSALGDVQAEYWPQYTLQEPYIFFFSANETSHPIPDTYRGEAINYLMDIILARQGRNCTGLVACGAPVGIALGNTDGPPSLLNYGF